ncbi:MAG: signal recognition particle-docking protein FtsY [Candidatus Aenigmatarchaeota archaeon]
MFGSLKKKLKELTKKFSKESEEQRKEETIEPEITEEIKIEAHRPEREDVKKTRHKEEEKLIEEEVSEPEEEPANEERKPMEKIFELEKAKSKEEKTVSKPGFLKRLTKKVAEKKLTESDVNGILHELNRVLLENDVAYPVAEKICDDVKNSLVGSIARRGKTEETIRSALRDAMLGVMSQKKIDIDGVIHRKKPFLIVFLGFNGTGKTTTIAKLAHKLKKKHKIVFAAGDTFRAASIEQIEVHAKRLGVDVIKHKYGADSAAVIFDAVKHAEARHIDVVLADTAGRSHSNVNLMDELKKVCRVNKPDMKILVLDSLTGNDIYDQAKMFDDAVGIDAMVLTKADVYEKGGAALSASYTTKKPILYLGTGQEYDDLEEFDPEKITDGLIG